MLIPWLLFKYIHVRILVPKVEMASSGLLANFILGVKFLTRKLKFLESYKHFFFFLQLRVVFPLAKLPTSLYLTVMEKHNLQA